ncbi:MAG: arginase family protein, partial [Halobacteriovoraceae bacterium]|nr:arginase family protein [Halobacteriovoraceae bacterium]
AKKKNKIKCAVIHFDAHTDLMDKRLGIDICFASWAKHILKYLDSPKNLIQFGIRSSGENKQYWEEKFGLSQYWSDEILASHQIIIEKVITELKQQNIEEIYISFDIDTLDAQYASATGTPEINGLPPHICCDYISQLGAEFKVTGADLVEVAPFVRSQSQTLLAPEPETTLLSSQFILNKLHEVMK